MFNNKETKPIRIPHWRLIIDRGVLTQEIIEQLYPGQGTPENPYVVQWISNDPRNPFDFSRAVRWIYAFTMAITVLALSLGSSAYASGKSTKSNHDKLHVDL